MQDNNQKDLTSNDDVTTPNVETTTDVHTPKMNEASGDLTSGLEDVNETSNQVQSVTPVATATKKTNPVWVILAVAVVVLGILFALEKGGRISTGLFSAVISEDRGVPVAKVNGVDISSTDFDSSVKQLLQMAASQGADTTDPAQVDQFKKQAIDTLINGELLRQDAIAEGMTATKEAIDARFSEIRDGIGGEEQLVARMAEFGITEKILRRDIENEILIQGLFDNVIGTEGVEVSDGEVEEFYAGLGGEGVQIPPLADVKEQIVEQIKISKQQELIGNYLENLKSESEIEILI